MRGDRSYRPRDSAVVYAETAKSFDEASERTGWFADGPGEHAMFRCPMGCTQTADGTLYVTVCCVAL
jgi:hypothetical protein